MSLYVVIIQYETSINLCLLTDSASTECDGSFWVIHIAPQTAASIRLSQILATSILEVRKRQLPCISEKIK